MQTGVLRPDHIARYAELGNWLTECYSTAVTETMSFTASATGPSATLTVSLPQLRDCHAAAASGTIATARGRTAEKGGRLPF